MPPRPDFEQPTARSSTAIKMLPAHTALENALDDSFISTAQFDTFDALPSTKILAEHAASANNLAMRTPIFFHYCSQRTRCNHYYLTVFTFAVLLFVGCSSVKTEQEEK